MFLQASGHLSGLLCLRLQPWETTHATVSTAFRPLPGYGVSSGRVVLGTYNNEKKSPIPHESAQITPEQKTTPQDLLQIMDITSFYNVLKKKTEKSHLEHTSMKLKYHENTAFEVVVG